MKHLIISIIILFFVSAGLSAVPAAAGTDVKGLFLFSDGSIYNYEIMSDKTASLKASAPMEGTFAKYFTCAGMLYSSDSIHGMLIQFDVGLKKTPVGLKIDDNCKVLGSDGRYVFVMSGNSLSIMDPGLKTLAKTEVNSDPGHTGYFISRAVFHGDKAFLFDYNTGLINCVDYSDISKPALTVSKDVVSPEPRAMWADPASRSVCLLITRSEIMKVKHLPPGMQKETNTEYVYTFDMNALDKKPGIKEVYKEKFILQPHTKDRGDESGIGLVMEMQDPKQRDGDPEGTFFCRLSAATPCFARITDRTIKAGRDQYAVMLDRGRYDLLDVFRDDISGVKWAKYKDSAYYIEEDLKDNRLNVYPHEFSAIRNENRDLNTGVLLLTY